MNSRTQVACAACGIGFVVFYVLGWWLIAGFVPPHPPLSTATELAASYAEHTGAIRFGILVAMIGAGLAIPFVGVVAVHVRRIEGAHPVLAFTTLAAGAVTSVIPMLPTVLWTAAAFRPERSPELILVLNDLGWLFLLMTFPPFFVQFTSVGLAILSDEGTPPVFARWVGYFNIWLAVIAVPGGLVTFFKTGPFAWNGLLAFWLPIVAFVLWFFVMFAVLLAAIRSTANEA